MSNYVTDPIGDLLTRIRNAQRARSKSCRVPYSRMKHSICTLLKNEGWIESVGIEGEGTTKRLFVTFIPEKSSLELKRVSKPGRRIYAGYEELLPVLRGFGIAILTTSAGLLTDREARKRKLGGEVLCTIS